MGSGRSEMSSPGKASLVHVRAQITGSTDQTCQPGVQRGQDHAQLVEGGFRRAVRTPARIGLDGCVRRDVEDPGSRGPVQVGFGGLNEAKRRQQVRLHHAAERSERVPGQRGERARPPGVLALLTKQLQGAEAGLYLQNQLLPVAVVGDVAGDGHHAGPGGPDPVDGRGGC